MKIHVLIENTTADPRLRAEHGLSLLVQTEKHLVLFDTGQSGAFADNAAQMGLDLRAVDLCILSHGHYDHGGGLARFLALNDRAPVYVSRHAFMPHYNGQGKYNGLDRSLPGSDRLVLTDGPLQLDEELSLCTCTPEEMPAPVEPFGLQMQLGGAFFPDDFRHEQYLLVRDNGRRVLFSGCSHKGILNIMHCFRPDILVGGFHLMKLDPALPAARQRLEETARQLAQYPTMYYTGHCTGGGQYRILKQALGDRLEYLATGRSFTL